MVVANLFNVTSQFQILFFQVSGWWFQPYPSEKYEFVNGKDDIPYIRENKKCLKPPTSYS
jgi:hypothetical protein